MKTNECSRALYGSSQPSLSDEAKHSTTGKGRFRSSPVNAG